MKPKKTTLMFEESVYDQVRKAAAERGASMSDVVAEALQSYFSSTVSAPRKRLLLTTAEGGGWIGPLDPRRNAELLDAIEDVTEFGQ